MKVYKDQIMKKVVLHSGGMDSLALMLDAIENYGKENIISLGFNYGQRHFKQENAAAVEFCKIHGIPRTVLDAPIHQIGGCSLIDHSIPVTTDMSQQRSTVVPMRNGIFLMFAAAFAEVNKADVVIHGACAEDYAAYRDCRPQFFKYLEIAIQAGRTQPVRGSEAIIDDFGLGDFIPKSRLDLQIETPLIKEKKEDTVKRIVAKHGVDVYYNSYSCYNGGDLSCGVCPACVERLNAFKVNGLTDPIKYNESAVV